MAAIGSEYPPITVASDRIVIWNHEIRMEELTAFKVYPGRQNIVLLLHGGMGRTRQEILIELSLSAERITELVHRILTHTNASFWLDAHIMTVRTDSKDEVDTLVSTIIFENKTECELFREHIASVFFLGYEKEDADEGRTLVLTVKGTLSDVEGSWKTAYQKLNERTYGKVDKCFSSEIVSDEDPILRYENPAYAIQCDGEFRVREQIEDVVVYKNLPEIGNFGLIVREDVRQYLELMEELSLDHPGFAPHWALDISNLKSVYEAGWPRNSVEFETIINLLASILKPEEFIREECDRKMTNEELRASDACMTKAKELALAIKKGPAEDP